MAAVCNVVSRATVAPKVSVRAKNTSARAFMGRTAPLKAPGRRCVTSRGPDLHCTCCSPSAPPTSVRPADDDRSPDRNLAPIPSPPRPIHRSPPRRCPSMSVRADAATEDLNKKLKEVTETVSEKWRRPTTSRR